MAVDLANALDALRDRTGARSVRVVDGRTGEVVAVSGDPAADPVDGPAAVVRLLEEVADASAGDACVGTPGSVHLLRPVDGVAGAFVHLMLPVAARTPEAAHVIQRARAALAAPALHRVVGTVLDGGVPTVPVRVAVDAPPTGGPQAGDGVPPGPAVPGDDPAGGAPAAAADGDARAAPGSPAAADGPRSSASAAADHHRGSAAAPAGGGPGPPRPADGPAGAVPPAGDRGVETTVPVRVPVPPPALGPAAAPPPAASAPPAPGELPAFAVLAGDRPGQLGDAALGAAALAGLTAALPRRVPGRPAAPTGGTVVGLPRLRWARDQDTLQRIVSGLRRLS